MLLVERSQLSPKTHLIVGPAKCGKTNLARAIITDIREKNDTNVVVVTNHDQLLWRDCVVVNNILPAMEYVRIRSVIVIDDAPDLNPVTVKMLEELRNGIMSVVIVIVTQRSPLFMCKNIIDDRCDIHYSTNQVNIDGKCKMLPYFAHLYATPEEFVEGVNYCKQHGKPFIDNIHKNPPVGLFKIRCQQPPKQAGVEQKPHPNNDKIFKLMVDNLAEYVANTEKFLVATKAYIAAARDDTSTLPPPQITSGYVL